MESIFSKTASFVKEKPLYNLDKFGNPDDKKLLDAKVKELKLSHDTKPTVIQLSKGKVTIVVS